MVKEYISIQDAAKISGKSVQTIRRAIKAKKLKVRKKKTPQGFNYKVKTSSVYEVFKIKAPKENTVKTDKSPKKEKPSNRKSAVTKQSEKEISIEANDFKDFVKTMETLLAQHNEERKSFLQLVNTMQEKIFVLENQLNLLKAPPKKRWFSFRK